MDPLKLSPKFDQIRPMEKKVMSTYIAVKINILRKEDIKISKSR